MTKELEIKILNYLFCNWIIMNANVLKDNIVNDAKLNSDRLWKEINGTQYVVDYFNTKLNPDETKLS